MDEHYHAMLVSGAFDSYGVVTEELCQKLRKDRQIYKVLSVSFQNSLWRAERRKAVQGSRCDDRT